MRAEAAGEGALIEVGMPAGDVRGCSDEGLKAPGFPACGYFAACSAPLAAESAGEADEEGATGSACADSLEGIL